MDTARLAPPGPRQLRYGVIASCLAHVSVWLYVRPLYEPPLQPPATRVEFELAMTQPREQSQPSAAVAPVRDSGQPRRAKAARPRARTAEAPARAAPAASAEPPAPAPEDFTHGTLVVAASTPSHAAASRAAAGPSPAGPAGTSDLSSVVALEGANWSCPWPPGAAAELIDEQLVVIRVMVGAAGNVEAVLSVTDPGQGFGAAAAACALQTRFTPARDRAGKPFRAQSPPIRVLFTR